MEQAYEVLIETAQDEATIYYGELMDTIGTSWGYIGMVLGGVNRLELQQGNPTLSALAVRKENDMPGEGLSDNLLVEFGLWGPGEDREQAWREQVQRVYEHLML